MKILVCDSSHAQGLVGLLAHGTSGIELLGAKRCQPIAEFLVPSVQALLGQFSTELEDLKLIVAVQGPGSFTGLRMGIAMVKTWGTLLKVPVVGVSTLQAMAYHAYCLEKFTGKEFLPVVHASSDEFYAAVYENGLSDQGLPCAILKDQVVSRTQLQQWSTRKGVVILGAGGAKAGFESALPLVPEALPLAQMGFNLWKRGVGILDQRSEPVYLRLSEAEKKRGVRVQY